MKTFKLYLTYFSLILSSGFAIFTMFFGSGNLVFPLSIGQMAGPDYFLSMLGLFSTAVLLPFLGLFCIFLYNGSAEQFFKRVGKYPGLLLPIIILSLMGPLAVMPRCITVSYASFTLMTESVSLWQFSLINCLIMLGLSFDKGKIVPLLGNVLTPILLFSLAMIIYCGLEKAPFVAETASKIKAPFIEGMNSGYLMMDLLAAFFFASTVITYLRNKLSRKSIPEKHKKPIILLSLILGVSSLGVIYGFLVYLGSVYSSELATVPTEKGITYIAFKTLGQGAGPVVATAVTLACITTAIILTSVVGEFYHKKIFRQKLSPVIVNSGIILLTFFISTLEFSGIAAYLGPLLNFLYPGIIVMTLLSIGEKSFNLPYKKALVYITFLITFIVMVFF